MPNLASAFATNTNTNSSTATPIGGGVNTPTNLASAFASPASTTYSPSPTPSPNPVGSFSPKAPSTTNTITPSELLQGQNQQNIASGNTTPEEGNANLSMALGNDDSTSALAPTSESTGTQLSQVNQYVQKTADSVFNEVGGNAILHPIDTIKTLGTKIYGDEKNAGKGLLSSAAQYTADQQEYGNANGGLSVKNVANTLNLLTSAAGTLFNAVATPVFDIAGQMPVLKPAADAVGLILNESGKLTSFLPDKLLSSLPISQDTKDQLTTPIHSVSTLAGQIILGGYIYESIVGAMEANPPKGGTTGGTTGGITGDTTDLPASVTKEIVEDATLKAQEINTQAEAEKEPTSKPPTTLSDISQDKTNPVDLRERTQPTGTPVRDVNAPVSDEITKPSSVKSTENNNNPSDEITKPKVRNVNGLREIEGTGDVKNPSASKNFESAAIKAQLVESFGDLPEYKIADFGAMADDIHDLIEKDPDRAKEIAMGQRNPPKGILASMVYRIFANKALADGDGELSLELSKSTVPVQGKTAGQFIGGFKGIDSENPTEVIRDLQKSREEAATKKSADEIQKAQDSVKQATVDRVSGKVKMDWSSFIQSISC